MLAVYLPVCLCVRDMDVDAEKAVEWCLVSGRLLPMCCVCVHLSRMMLMLWGGAWSVGACCLLA